MKTEYYCKDCEERWTEDAIPNIHRKHRCGAIARIVKAAAYGDQTV